MPAPAAEVVEISWRPASSAQRQALLALLFAPADSAPPAGPVLAPGSGDGSPGVGHQQQRRVSARAGDAGEPAPDVIGAA